MNRTHGHLRSQRSGSQGYLSGAHGHLSSAREDLHLKFIAHGQLDLTRCLVSQEDPAHGHKSVAHDGLSGGISAHGHKDVSQGHSSKVISTQCHKSGAHGHSSKVTPTHGGLSLINSPQNGINSQQDPINSQQDLINSQQIKHATGIFHLSLRTHPPAHQQPPTSRQKAPRTSAFSERAKRARCGERSEPQSLVSAGGGNTLAPQSLVSAEGGNTLAPQSLVPAGGGNLHHTHPQPHKGMTLIETIVALFLMVIAVIVITRLSAVRIMETESLEQLNYTQAADAYMYRIYQDFHNCTGLEVKDDDGEGTVSIIFYFGAAGSNVYRYSPQTHFASLNGNNMFRCAGLVAQGTYGRNLHVAVRLPSRQVLEYEIFP